MKKYILSLLTVLVCLSACKKEDDLLQPIPQHTTTTTSNSDTTVIIHYPDTAVLPDTSFIGLGYAWNIIESSFSFNSYDTTYEYYHTNVGSAYFHETDTNAYITTTVYPVNSTQAPTHSVNYSYPLLTYEILGVTYTQGMVVLDLKWVPCNGAPIYWSATMIVTQYEDNTFALSLDNVGYQSNGPQQGPWNSSLYLRLEKK